jgi:hypothetical protein
MFSDLVPALTIILATSRSSADEMPTSVATITDLSAVSVTSRVTDNIHSNKSPSGEAEVPLAPASFKEDLTLSKGQTEGRSEWI